MASLPLQTFSAPNKPLFGAGGGAAISSFQTASVSSLTVSSINGVQVEDLDPGFWSFFPAVNSVNMAGYSITNTAEVSALNTDLFLEAPNPASTIQFLVGGYAPSNLVMHVKENVVEVLRPLNTSTITASTITVNELIALSTIHAISTVSTTTASIQEITNLSSINGQSLSTLAGAADWSYYPALSSIQGNGFDIVDVNDVNASRVLVNSASTQTQVYSANIGENFAFLVQSTDQTPGDHLETYITTGGAVNGFNISHLLGSNALGQITMNSNGVFIYDSNLNAYIFNDGFSASSINVSSINGLEFTPSTLVTSSITTQLVSSAQGTFSNLASDGFSTIGASIQAGLMSSIQFNPSFNPTFNIDMGLGQFGGALVGTLGAGIFGVLVAVPVTVGTITYGLTKGLASLFEPRPINNINSNVFETYNYQTQLQVSTLGEQISSIYRFISTIPSTIVINADSTFSTVSETNVEIYISTISPPAPVVCMRSIGDPVQTASTPWTYEQSFGQWVEIPAGGVGSNVSTFTLSTLTLAPSTILRGLDLPGGVLEVLENPYSGAYGQVAAQTYTMAGTVGGSNGTLYYADVIDRPGFVDNALGTHTLAYLTDIPAFDPDPVFSTVRASGDITSENTVNVVQSPPQVGSAFATLTTGIDAAGDASFYGVNSNAVGWGKFRVNNGSNGIDIVNAVGGFQSCVFNVGNDGAFTFTDSNAVVSQISSGTLFINNVSTGTVNGVAYPPAANTNTLYVAKNGNDTTGNGSIAAPYLTIQKAIDVAELTASVTNLFVIYIAPGDYIENITFTDGCISLIGAVASQNKIEITEITGSVTVAVTANASLFENQVILSGLSISGTITDTSTVNHSLLLQDTNVFSAGRALYVNSSSADQRTNLINCQIQQTSAGANPVVEIANGVVEIERCDIFTAASQNCVLVSGDANAVRVVLSAFENSSSSTTVAALFAITSSSALVHNIGNNTFSFTTLANRTGSPTSCALLIDAGSTNVTVAFTQNECILLGTADTVNNVIQKGAGMSGIATVLLGLTGALSGTTTTVDTALVITNFVTPQVVSQTVSTLALNASTITAPANVNTSTLTVSTINGAAFPLYYASFYSQSTIGNAGANVVMPAGCEVAQYVAGNIVSTDSTIIINETGTFEVTTSIQLATATNTNQPVIFWFKKNGSNIPNSASQVGVTKDIETLATLSLVEQFVSGDELQVVWQSPDTAMSSLYIAGAGNYPDIPSNILNIKQIGL